MGFVSTEDKLGYIAVLISTYRDVRSRLLYQG
jgi:hypothetical protein